MDYRGPVTTVALVSGANRGIGLEICRQLAARGAVVYLGARDLYAGRLAAKSLDRAGVTAVQLDVTDLDSVTAAVDQVGAEQDRLDVLINNAGAHYDTSQSSTGADLDIVEQALDTNVLGPWRLAQACIPLLRASPAPRLVNVSSGSGSFDSIGATAPAYCVSKAALNALTVSLAADLRDSRILVNAVCPGWVATDMGGTGGRPVTDGAASVLWAVDLPDSGPSGGFYRDGHPLPW